MPTPIPPDAFSRYERALAALRQQIPVDHPQAETFFALEIRLRENLDTTRRYGNTEQRRAERTEILVQLNHLTRDLLGVDFDALQGSALGSVESGATASTQSDSEPTQQRDNAATTRNAPHTVRHINTGGGDYAEGNIDKRRITVVHGDRSGNSSDAILTIKSTLSNVSQSIGATLHGNTALKAQLQTLIAQLSVELQRVPAEQAEEAKQVAQRAERAVAEALKLNPDQDDVEYNLSRLKKAAKNIAPVLPTVLPLVEQIADVLWKMAEG